MVCFSSGSTMNIAVEIHERRGPVTWFGYRFRPDSMGAGEHQGGVGTSRLLRVDQDRTSLSAIGDRERFQPWGLFGGKPAPGQKIIRRRRDGTEESLGMFFANVLLDDGDEVVYLSTGGGGYGPPERRPLEKILDDVRNEYITPAYAYEHYGVVIDAVDPEALDYRIDEEATRARRAELFGS
jgi:N-methylhydantoinase B/oxoprolinase/acetone carboxylase alpha subunit